MKSAWNQYYTNLKLYGRDITSSRLWNVYYKTCARNVEQKPGNAFTPITISQVFQTTTLTDFANTVTRYIQ